MKKNDVVEAVQLIVNSADNLEKVIKLNSQPEVTVLCTLVGLNLVKIMGVLEKEVKNAGNNSTD